MPHERAVSGALGERVASGTFGKESDLDKPPKIKSEQALQACREARCLECGVRGCDPHHLPSPFGASRRYSDLVVPLCRACHEKIQTHPKLESARLPYYYGVALGMFGLESREIWQKIFCQAALGLSEGEE